MKTSTAIVVVVVLIGAIAWLRETAPKSCESRSIVSATAPHDQYVARAETRKCDAGLESGFFIVVKKSTEPGVLYDVFHSARDLHVVALQWSSERDLLVRIAEPLDEKERQYEGRAADGGVILKLVDSGDAQLNR